MRRDGSCVVERRVALVVEKMDGEAWIDSWLVGLVSGPVTLLRLKRTNIWAWSEMRWSMRTEN